VTPEFPAVKDGPFGRKRKNAFEVKDQENQRPEVMLDPASTIEEAATVCALGPARHGVWSGLGVSDN
jgi:hypothetical protein